jgi:hypothetical protein
MKKPPVTKVHVLQQRRERLWNEAYALADAACAVPGGRHFTEPEERRFELLDREIDSLDKEIAELRRDVRPRGAALYLMTRRYPPGLRSANSALPQ